jgi:hypothetical protein
MNLERQHSVHQDKTLRDESSYPLVPQMSLHTINLCFLVRIMIHYCSVPGVPFVEMEIFVEVLAVW